MDVSRGRTTSARASGDHALNEENDTRGGFGWGGGQPAPGRPYTERGPGGRPALASRAGHCVTRPPRHSVAAAEPPSPPAWGAGGAERKTPEAQTPHGHTEYTQRACHDIAGRGQNPNSTAAAGPMSPTPPPRVLPKSREAVWLPGLLLVKPGQTRGKVVEGFGGYAQACRAKVIAQPINPFFNPSNTRLVEMFVQLHSGENLIDHLDRRPQLPAGRGQHQGIIHERGGPADSSSSRSIDAEYACTSVLRTHRKRGRGARACRPADFAPPGPLLGRPVAA